MSFNTQHCNNFLTGQIDYDVIADAIKQCAPDIVGLNEMRDKGERDDYEAQVSFLMEKTGMQYGYFAKAIDCRGNNPYGNGFLSKHPIKKVQTIMIPDPEVKTFQRHYETRCVLKAELENGLVILVTHFGLNPDEQENAVKTVIEQLESEKCILMGDFNMLPDNNILMPIRERMRDTADCFQAPLYSFPSDKPERKIDYIFVSPDIEVLEADIPPIVASDHRPHTAKIQIKALDIQ